MTKKGKIVDMYQPEGDPSTGYAGKLESLIKTFERDFPVEFDLEDVIEFAVNAWNYANLDKALTEEELIDFKDIMMLDEDEDNVLFEKMVAAKQADFAADDQIIEDFELDNHKDGVTLTLETMSKGEYIDTYIDDFESDGHLEIEDEEGFINRYAIILKAKEPFIQWLKALNQEEDYADDLESNVYLVRDEVRDLHENLKYEFDTYFKLELDEWTEDQADWPKDRTYEMFKEWFSVDVSTMIYDMENTSIYKD